MKTNLLVTSHAACKGHAPENTLAGVRRALALAADAIEVDVRCTADGVPVLLHDETVDRTTNGSGAINSLTFAEARRLDAGDERFPGEPIPSLQEAIGLTKGRALLVLELKQPGIEKAALDVVWQEGDVRGCVVHSFLPSVVARVRQLEPRLPCVLLTASAADRGQLLDSVLAVNAQGVAVLHSLVDEELVAEANRRSLRLYCWTVNEEPEMRRLIACGVDGITSDHPERVRNVLSAP
ncbi:MAG: glycerophosphodiester phosphodiesterase family protein [Dehalococcoidia bacterium]|jgi:glycerophosphoryl diester phosphodiesterase